MVQTGDPGVTEEGREFSGEEGNVRGRAQPRHLQEPEAPARGPGRSEVGRAPQGSEERGRAARDLKRHLQRRGQRGRRTWRGGGQPPGLEAQRAERQHTLGPPFLTPTQVSEVASRVPTRTPHWNWEKHIHPKTSLGKKGHLADTPRPSTSTLRHYRE